MLAGAAEGCCRRNTWRGCHQTAAPRGARSRPYASASAPGFLLGITPTGEYGRGVEGRMASPILCLRSAGSLPGTMEERRDLKVLAFFRDDEGQGLVEYALIIAVIAIAVIVAMIFLRGQLQNIFSNIGNNLT